MRTLLSPGTAIELKCDGGAIQQYEIGSVIGEGANCVAYEARRTDAGGAVRHYRIKECYPYNARTERRGSSLTWGTEEERDVAFSRLRTAHKLIVDLRNTESVGNNITSAELCEGNGTLYSVMEVNHAKTYDKDTSEDLHRILETVWVLTDVVGNLHEQGYLHLDIKPENFLVNHRPNTNIWLFDVDSLVSMEELESGEIQTVSYSQRWAAPEQLRGQMDKLCPATDVYAIGAVLFEKVMGRPVSNEDTGLFAEWEFNGEMFEDVNPTVKRFLREIFKKTLSASVKRRYQSTKELEGVLRRACDLTLDGKPFLIGNCPPITNEFIGRNSELSQIEQAFDANCRTVFLHGEGGIGKSLLAIAYAEKYQQKYDVALFARYKGSLEQLVDDIEIQNVDPDSDDKQKILRRLLDKNVLLIVDNFDVEVDQDDFLEDLLQFKTNILFTTRTDFSGVYSGKTLQIEVGQLGADELTQLFSRASGTQADEKQQPYLKKLFKAVGYNTYATELLGSQIAASGYSLEALSAKITDGLDAFKGAEKVRTKKDGRVVKRTIPEIIRVLFQVADLSEVRQQVLRNMYLLRFLNITRDTYAEFTCESATGMDALNDMLELGWVRKSGVYFVLHPLVEQLVENDLTPNMDNCPAVYYSISSRIHYCCNFDDCSEAAQEKYDQTCDFLCAFFCNVPLDAENNRKLLFGWLDGIIENENTEIGSPVHSRFPALYQCLIDLISKHKTTAEETLKIRSIILEAWIREFATIYCGDADYNQMMNQQRQDKLKDVFWKTVEATQFLDVSEREKTLDRIYEQVLNASWLFSTQKAPAEFVQQLYRERPQACTLSAHEKKDRGLPLNAEELAEIEKFYKDNPVFAPGYTDADIDEERECKQKFRDADDKVAFIEEIINNKAFPAIKRAELVWYCTDMMLGSLHWEVPSSKARKEYIETIDWHLMYHLLSVEEDFLISDEMQCESRSDHVDWNMYINHNTVNQTVVAAILGEVDDFDVNMNMLMEDIGRDVKWSLAHNIHWSHLVSLRDSDNAPLWYVLNGLRQIEKTGWVLPYLIRFATGWEAYAKEKGDWDQEPFFPIYRSIVECADNAYFEKDIPAQYKMDYLDIWSRYQGYTDEITGTTYTLRLKEE